jgi:hypothetical protein
MQKTAAAGRNSGLCVESASSALHRGCDVAVLQQVLLV